MKILFISFLKLTLLLASLGFNLDAQRYDDLKLHRGTFYSMLNPFQPGSVNLYDMTQDSQGYIYACGHGANILTTNGAYQTTPSRPWDVFVCKFSPDLSTLVWSTYIGGNETDKGTGIAVNSQGQVYVVGYEYSGDFPITFSSDQSNLSYGNGRTFISKLSADGSQLLYSRVLYAIGQYYSVGVAVNAQDEAILYGTNVPGYYTTANAYQPSSASSQDLVLTKFSPTGNILYSTFIGGSGIDIAGRIRYANSKIYLTGKTKSADFPLATGKTPDAAGDAFVMVWNDGTVPTPVTTRVFGGSGADESRGICYNAVTNKIYVNGMTESSDMPYTSLQQPGQTTGGFMASMNSDLSTMNYLSIIGASLMPWGIRAKNNGDAVSVCASLTSSATVPLSPTAYSTANLGSGTIGITVLSSTEELIYGSYIARTGETLTPCVSLVEFSQCAYQVVIAAAPVNYGFPTTPNTFQQSPSNNGSNGGFAIFKTNRPDSSIITPTATCGEFQFTGTTSGSGNCTALGVSWNFGDGSALQSGNPVLHKYAKNGTYTAIMRVAYPGADTLFYSRTINVQSQPILQVSPHTAYRCTKDTGVILRVSGAVRYEWHPGIGLSDSTINNPRARPTRNTQYIVRGYDANGCFADDTVQVYVTAITAGVSGDTVICAGGSVTLRATGAAEYRWFPPQGLSVTNKATVVATPTQTTTYNVIVSEASCADTAKVTVGIAHAPGLRLSPAAVVCTGGSTQLSAQTTSSGLYDTVGVVYTWTPESSLSSAHSAQPVASPVVTTRYRCVATNAYGCVSRDSVEVKVQSALDLKLSGDTLTCRGSTLTLMARGGASYSWSPRQGLDDSTSATPRCTPSSTTTYRVMTWSGNFATATCRDTAELTVDVFDLPAVHVYGSTTVCPLTPVTLRCDSSVLYERYVWTNDTGQVMGHGATLVILPDTTRRYILTVSTAQGCFSSDTAQIIVQSTLAVKAQGAQTVTPGTTVILHVQNPESELSYEWTDATGTVIGSTDSVSITATTTSWYYLRATRGGCHGLDSVLITVLDVVPVIAPADTSVCQGATLHLNVINEQAGSSYSWTDQHGVEVSKVAALDIVAQQDSVFIVTAHQVNTSSADTVRVTMHSAPTCTVHDQRICQGESIIIGTDSSGTQDPSERFEWMDEHATVISRQRSVRVTPLSTTSYTVRVTNQFGCSITRTLGVAVDPQELITLSADGVSDAMVTESVSLPIYASSRQDLSLTRLRFEVHVPRSMMDIPGAVVRGNELVVSYDQPMQLASSPQRIMTISGMMLANQQLRDSLRIENPSSSLSTSCVSFKAMPAALSIKPICANNLAAIELVESTFMVRPNPTGGDISFLCSDPEAEIQIMSLVGTVIDSLIVQKQQGSTEQTATLSGLPDGLYILRARVHGRVICQMVTVMR